MENNNNNNTLEQQSEIFIEPKPEQSEESLIRKKN